MRKSIAILITLFVISVGNLTWAEEKMTTKDAEDFLSLGIERLKKERAEAAEKRAKYRAEINAKVRAWETKRQPRLSEFKKTLKPVGRFQAINIPRLPFVVILDTKEGHLWLWKIMSKQSSLTYGGQLCPGEYMGEKIIYLLKED